jgi:hypothetical protein
MNVTTILHSGPSFDHILHIPSQMSLDLLPSAGDIN